MKNVKLFTICYVVACCSWVVCSQNNTPETKLRSQGDVSFAYHALILSLDELMNRKIITEFEEDGRNSMLSFRNYII